MKFASFALLPALASAAAVAANDAAEIAAIRESIRSSPSLMYKRFWRTFANQDDVISQQENLAAAPPTTIPKRVEGKGIYFPDAKRVTIRYGPYMLPPANLKTAESMLLKVNGVTNKFEKNAMKPCEECTILALNSELQYADGSEANTKTGAWLHHTGMVNTGAGLKDPMCGMPGIENFFEEGNERSQTFYGNNGTIRAGLKVGKQHSFFLLNEFVNMKNDPQWVWIAYNYELKDGPQPDYKKSHYLLLSVGPSCNTKMSGMFGASNLTLTGQPKPSLKVFNEHSIPWISPYDGVVLGTGGHLHDGGLAVKVYQNDQLLCDSVAEYGTSPNSEGAAMASMGGKGMAKRDGAPPAGSYESGNAHIERMSACAVGGRIKKGDQIRLVAEYDFNKHPGMVDNHGDLDEVMGMAGFLVSEDVA